MSVELPAGVKIETGLGGLPVIRVRTELAEADIYLHGAHITHFQPAGEKPVLYLSPNSKFEPGKAIRGGIPICWPWFGPHPTDPTQPQHGYVRTAEWATKEATPIEGGMQIRLDYSMPDRQLKYFITVGRSLVTRLETWNHSDAPLTITEALHSYLAVSDVRQITVDGVGGCEYLDRVTGGRARQGDEPIRFAAEFDRTYVNAEKNVTVTDPAWQRRIVVKKADSKSTVVWNPAEPKASSLADMGSGSWIGFVCVETANAAENAVAVAPNGVATMQSTLTVERI